MAMNDTISFKVPPYKVKDEYIGFHPSSGTFIFPCQYFSEQQTYEQNTALYHKEARNIIFLLKHVCQDYLFGDGKNELIQFHSMIWLLQDYVDRGYYTETETVNKNSSPGRINWKRTIKQNRIFYNNSNIIYSNFVYNRVMMNESRIITQIYKACLAYSVERLGFIYGLTKTAHTVFDVDKDRDFIIFYLKNELNNTFRDYKKTLIGHLLSIVTHQSNKAKNVGYAIYDKEFEYVFEFLVNYAFGTEDVKKFYNAYSYCLNDLSDLVPASRLRPDTITKDELNNTYFIVDSKYYNYGYTHNPKHLPESSSISKQLGYNHYLKDHLIDTEKDFWVRSVFVLPYASTKEGEYIKYVGYAQRDDSKDVTADHIDNRVAICLIDLKELIHTYMEHSTNLSPKTLIDCINRELGSIVKT